MYEYLLSGERPTKQPLGVLTMNTRTFRRSTLLAAAFVAAGMISWTAEATAATTNTEVLKEVVTYGDLNLNRPEGVTALYRRVSHAAVAVCTPFESRELTQMSAWKQCVSASISRAVAQINIPALTAYANARDGHASSPVLAAQVK